MQRTCFAWLVALACLAGVAGPDARAQYGNPGAAPYNPYLRPAISPYLGMLRPGTPFQNYATLTGPQLNLYAGLGLAQDQAALNQQAISGLALGQQPYGYFTTGHLARFMTARVYFMNNNTGLVPSATGYGMAGYGAGAYVGAGYGAGGYGAGYGYTGGSLYGGGVPTTGGAGPARFGQAGGAPLTPAAPAPAAPGRTR